MSVAGITRTKSCSPLLLARPIVLAECTTPVLRCTCSAINRLLPPPPPPRLAGGTQVSTTAMTRKETSQLN